MKLFGRLVASVLALVTTSTLSTSASAEPTTLAELLARTAESARRVTESAVKVSEARARYDAQLDTVRAAAAEVLRAFANDHVAAREPAPEPGPRLRSLLLDTTPRLSGLRSLTLATPTRSPVLRSLTLGATPRLPVLRPLVITPAKPAAPLSRLQALLASKPTQPKLADLRIAQPNGTSIYDSLTFRR